MKRKEEKGTGERRREEGEKEERGGFFVGGERARGGGEEMVKECRLDGVEGGRGCGEGAEGEQGAKQRQ